MKAKPILLLILFALGLYINSCDNPEETKATNIIPPVLVAPPDGSSNVPADSLTFRWSGVATKLEIDYTASFSPPVYSTNVSGNYYNMPPQILAHNQYYCWRVGVLSGSTMTWSNSVFWFITD